MDPNYEIYMDAEGKMRARWREGEVCDFCMTPNPTWEYPAGEVEITVNPVITNSDDSWGACDECHKLIEAGDMEALAVRSDSVQRALHPPNDEYYYPPRNAARRMLIEHFSRFMAARTGPAIPYEAEDG